MLMWARRSRHGRFRRSGDDLQPARRLRDNGFPLPRELRRARACELSGGRMDVQKIVRCLATEEPAHRRHHHREHGGGELV